jgi:hypothetical protein
MVLMDIVDVGINDVTPEKVNWNTSGQSDMMSVAILPGDILT